MNMKYITYEGVYCAEIVIFASSMEHVSMYTMLGTPKIIGAGFVDFEGVTCFGKSIGLGVPSHLNDTTILRRHCDY